MLFFALKKLIIKAYQLIARFELEPKNSIVPSMKICKDIIFD
jgi:hypothetical protein